ncbi:hypothetical protein CDV31_015563 [Fusarium ambrosium]|uniref:Heterokaryon incompatibility domain-containing protein n=1 Tax=Fusarium ambrosium TaxID=131363 RepID=A0A428SMQ1_9HYPO|nr:hypothetical protein CDV31_015563 [Fusarium ambrosium]
MPPTALCLWCALTPFYNLPSGLGKSERYYLGPGFRVKESPCPLCQLVVEAHYQNAEVLDENPVWLVWREGAEIGFAFEVPQAGRDVWISFGLLESTDHAVREMRVAHPGRCHLRPTTEPLIDTYRILDWVHNCEQRHGDECQLPTQVPFSEAFRGLPFIRLIDVQDGCLVEKQYHVKYITLSYVWGAVANFRLTRANRRVLLTPGSLDKVSDRLPATIRDTIGVVQRLGCRYLWVDALCLVQNDTYDLDQGVKTMDLIYERAWLTIVAACGHDANVRLPGAQYGTRKPLMNTYHVMPGITLGVVVGLDDLLGRSMYDTRGWTFQERMLSRRAIYFVDGKLFYRCRKTIQAEHLVDLPNATRANQWTVAQVLPRAILMRDPVYDFSSILRFYTKRILSDQSDAPRAMAGIIQRFSVAMGCQFLEGLPTVTFDLFILLRRQGDNLRRRAAFPSYSWTGWSGQMARLKTCNDSLRDKKWIIWYKRSPSGVVSLVWDPSDLSIRFYDMARVGYRESQPFSHGRYTPRHLDTSRTTPSKAISFSRDVPPYHILQFWTVSVFYTISDICVFDAMADLIDCNGTKCGSVWIDGFEETTYFESQSCFEFILLSESGPDSTHPFDDRIMAHPPVTKHSNKCFLVLLLEWRGGLAERRGFGYIFQEAMQNSRAPGPVWKEILLA